MAFAKKRLKANQITMKRAYFGWLFACFSGIELAFVKNRLKANQITMKKAHFGWLFDCFSGNELAFAKNHLKANQLTMKMRFLVGILLIFIRIEGSMKSMINKYLEESGMMVQDNRIIYGSVYRCAWLTSGSIWCKEAGQY